MPRKLAYLSGAARVSTHPEAEASGPRSHVLGILGGFRQLGWETDAFILGDLLPAQFSRQGSERFISGGGGRTYLADVFRLGLRPALPALALRRLGDQVDWAYERFSAMQNLGEAFQRHGVPWILETNALLFAESSSDRRTIAMVSVAKATEIQAYRRCDALVCTSQVLADLVIREARVDPHKIAVVPSGVDTEPFSSSHRTPRRMFDASTLGFVGALNPWQALHLPIEAIAELRREGIDYNLVVVGDGPMRHAWEELSGELGQSAHVRFVGRVPWSEVPGFVLGFDLGFSGQTAPAIGEMYFSPLKLYEYMAAGHPVVVSNYPEAMEVVEEGITGYRFAPGDKEDLKRALRVAYAQRDDWRAMGLRARAETVKNHTWAHRVEAMISLLEPILEERFGTAYPARRRR